MHWIHSYQLFLFDFDGLLVNTEDLHYRAYKKMCEEQGFSLPWDRKTYFQYALFSATAIREALYRDLPGLNPRWELLYQAKKDAYMHLLREEGVELMPGVAELLITLQHAGIKRGVVTHSPDEQVFLIRQHQPLLNTISTWITREHYSQPKPSSECYEKAIKMLAAPEDKIIGFEDSPRGLTSLLGTRAEGIFVTDFFNQEEIATLAREIGRPFSHHLSFAHMRDTLHV